MRFFFSQKKDERKKNKLFESFVGIEVFFYFDCKRSPSGMKEEVGDGGREVQT